MSVLCLPALIRGRHVRDEYRMPSAEFRARREKFADVLVQMGLEGCIAYSDGLFNGYVEYFTGYNCVITWSNAMFILDRRGKASLLASVPHRDEERLKSLIPPDVECSLIGLSLTANDHIGGRAAERLKKGFDVHGEWGGLNLSRAPWRANADIVSALGRVPDITSEFETLRAVKTPRELALIGRAAVLARQACEEFAVLCLPGGSELEAAADADRSARYNGAEDVQIMVGRSSAGGFLRFPENSLFAEGDVVKIYAQAQYLRYKAEYGLTADIGCGAGRRSFFDKAAADFEAAKESTFCGSASMTLCPGGGANHSSAHSMGMDLFEDPGLRACRGIGGVMKENSVAGIVLDNEDPPSLIADTFVAVPGGLTSLSGFAHSMKSSM